MKKIVFIGAGSLVFTRNLVRDILTYPALAGCEIALVDIHPEKLALVKKVVENIIAQGKYPATVTATTDRRQALPKADGVLITVAAGRPDTAHRNLEILMKYGVDICVGDTRGPAGIFTMLRTLPLLLDICADINALAPKAVVLNYTNPMAMLCRALQEKTDLQVTGLCHSVQGTVQMLARWIGAPAQEISYLCAGLNHQAHYVKLEWQGKDVYPLLREAMKDPAIWNEEQVRNEMFLQLGYYVTESSGHASEYVPWFRKRKDLLETFCTHGTGWNPGLHEMGTDFSANQDRWRDEFSKWLEADIDLRRGEEYASSIFNACFGDQTPFLFNGNLRNFGLIDNLPAGCCVEVPAVASKDGLQGIHVGPLPEVLAILNTQHALCEELAVQGFFRASREDIFHAICMDPLTGAVLSLGEIRRLTEELFAANQGLLPEFGGAPCGPR
jgi:alpha-galactosidase